MELKELRDELHDRLDRIEGKLDKVTEMSSKNESDISWLRGSIKFSVTIVVTLVTGLIEYLIHLYK